MTESESYDILSDFYRAAVDRNTNSWFVSREKPREQLNQAWRISLNDVLMRDILWAIARNDSKRMPKTICVRDCRRNPCRDCVAIIRHAAPSLTGFIERFEDPNAPPIEPNPGDTVITKTKKSTTPASVPATDELPVDPATNPQKILECRRGAETLRAAILHAKIHEMLIRHGTASIYVRRYPAPVVASVVAAYRLAGWIVRETSPFLHVDMPSKKSS